jgi:hypothetical protein
MKTLACFAILLALVLPATLPAAEVLPAKDRLQSCDPAIATAAANEILSDPKSVADPVTMFVPAEVLFHNGRKDDALFWFFAAQLRARYQSVFEHGDLAQVTSVMVSTIGPDISDYGFSNVSNFQRTLERVLAWDKRTPNLLREKPQTPEQRKQIGQVYAGLTALQQKLVADGPSLEESARRAAQAVQARAPQTKARCRPGQIDPSLVNQETRKEKQRVIALVRNHPDVIRAAGAVKDAEVVSSRTPNDSNMPNHYSVYVTGQHAMLAEVDVTRSSGDTQFTLRCTTSPSQAQHISKDPCAP